MITLDHLSPWTIIVRWAQEAHVKASPPAIDWTPRVDGSPHDDRLDLLTDLEQRLRGLSHDEQIVCRGTALGVQFADDGSVLLYARGGLLWPIGLNLSQVAKAAGAPRALNRRVKVPEVKRMLQSAVHQVEYNLAENRRRQLTLIAGGWQP